MNLIQEEDEADLEYESSIHDLAYDPDFIAEMNSSSLKLGGGGTLTSKILSSATGGGGGKQQRRRSRSSSDVSPQRLHSRTGALPVSYSVPHPPLSPSPSAVAGGNGKQQRRRSRSSSDMSPQRLHGRTGALPVSNSVPIPASALRSPASPRRISFIDESMSSQSSSSAAASPTPGRGGFIANWSKSASARFRSQSADVSPTKDRKRRDENDLAETGMMTSSGPAFLSQSMTEQSRSSSVRSISLPEAYDSASEPSLGPEDFSDPVESYPSSRTGDEDDSEHRYGGKNSTSEAGGTLAVGGLNNSSSNKKQGSSSRLGNESVVWSDYSSSADGSTQDDDSMPESGASQKRGAWFCGVPLQKRFTRRLKGIRVARCVATKSPCFWCFRDRHPTDRAILGRLNVLCGFFSSGQIASMLWLVIILMAPNLVDRNLDNGSGDSAESETTVFDVVNIWNTSGNVIALGLIACVILATALLTIKVIRIVDLVACLRFLWVIFSLMPVELFFILGCFDYFRVTDVWIRFWWRDETLAWFRHQYCVPSSTANKECTVPIVQNETQWCLDHYNATNCSEIRDSAQARTEGLMLFFYYINACWGFATLFLLLLSVFMLEKIVTRPLVQKSKETNLSWWLCLPTVGCLVTGALLSFSSSSVLNVNANHDAVWVGPMFIAAGGLFVVSALLAWYISNHPILSALAKKKKILAVLSFIGIMGVELVILVVLCGANIALTSSLAEIPMTDAHRGRIACDIDSAGSCTRCDELVNRCPEWTTSDVTRILQTQAKSAAALAAICCVYALGGIRFGFLLKKHITMYQIEYV